MSLSKLAVDPARLERDALVHQATAVAALNSRVKKFTSVTVQTLTKHLEELQQYIDVDLLVPYLSAELLLTPAELDIITNRLLQHMTPTGRLVQLLMYVGNKGPNGPRKFAECVWRSYTKTKHEGHKYVGELLSDSDPGLHCSRNERDGNAGQGNKRVLMMMEKFARLVANVLQKLLQIATIDLNQFKVYVTLIPPSENSPEDTITESDKQLIEQADSLEKIFGLLGKYWNYKNINLLASIVKRYGDEDTLQMVERYQKELRKFKDDPDHMPIETPPTARRNVDLSEMFADLIINILKAFDQIQIDLEKLRMYASLLPLGYRHFSQAHLDALTQAPSLASMLVIFGCYWDWRNYHILSCIVDQFGSLEMKEMVDKYHTEFMKSHSSSNIQRVMERRGLNDICLYKIEKKILKFKTRYANLVLEALLVLEKSTTLANFHRYLVSLPTCLQHPSIKMFSHNVAETQSWGATFLQLSPCWDYLNFKLLEHIIEKFGSQQLSDSLQAYCRDITDFVKETKVCDLVKVLPSRRPYVPAKSRLVKVTFTITGSWKGCTVEVFESLRQAFMRTLCLPDYVLIISGANVHISETVANTYCELRCYIPSSIACMMILKLQENADFYHKHVIACIKFHAEEKYYFDFLTSDNPENVLKRTEKYPVLAQEIEEVLGNISSVHPEVEYRKSNVTSNGQGGRPEPQQSSDNGTVGTVIIHRGFELQHGLHSVIPGDKSIPTGLSPSQPKTPPPTAASRAEPLATEPLAEPLATEPKTAVTPTQPAPKQKQQANQSARQTASARRPSHPADKVFEKYQVVANETYLSIEDLRYVVRALRLLENKWENIGTVLRVQNLDTIRKKFPNDPQRCLIAMLSYWLNGQYDTQRAKSPSWRMVAYALADRGGGDHRQRAEYVAKNHKEITRIKYDENVDGSPLVTADSDEQDIEDAVQRMASVLYTVAQCWYQIGLQLGVEVHRLDEIRGSDKECLRAMLKTGIETNPDCMTWQSIVEAVKHTAGGNNSALANDIATKHSSQPMDVH